MMSEKMTVAQELYDRLPMSMQGDIDDFLDYNTSVTIETRRDLIDAWLVWNGIIGYTDTMMAFFESVSAPLEHTKE